MSDLPSPGDVFRVRYPFVRCKAWCPPEEEGPGYEFDSWKPGVRCEFHGENEYVIADGEGEMILTVVSTHKPGHYPMRVFFTRRWVSPEGKEFGKNLLRIVTLHKFRRTAARYAVEYKVEADHD